MDLEADIDNDTAAREQDNVTPGEKADRERQRIQQCASQHGGSCEVCVDDCFERFKCAAPRLRCEHRVKDWCFFWLQALVQSESWRYDERLGIHHIDTYREPCLVRDPYVCMACGEDPRERLRDARFAAFLAKEGFVYCENCGQEWYPPEEVDEDEQESRRDS